jgi:predicted transcriptional regulator
MIMGKHVCSQKLLLKFIRKNPGLTNYQLSQRLGRDVSWLLRELVKKGLVMRMKGFNSATFRTAFQYYFKSIKKKGNYK